MIACLIFAQLNPKVNKALWDKDGVIQLQDPTKPFPVGLDNAPVRLLLAAGDDGLLISRCDGCS